MRRPATLLIAVVLAAASSIALAKGGGKPELDPIEVRFDVEYKSEDADARSRAIAELKKAPDPLKLALVSTRVAGREQRADVVAQAVEILASIRDPKTAATVAAQAKSASPDARLLYVEAIGSMAFSTEAHQMLLDLLKDKDAYVRGMAAAGLGEHRSIDALEPLLQLLDDRAWIVQAAALSSIPRLNDKEAVKRSIPKLVDFLENVSGRLRTDVSDCLRRISGRNLGRDPAVWRKWLDGGMMDAPAKPETDGDAPAKPKSEYANQDEPHFYGMPVQTNRVVLVLDISLSMYDAIEIDKERLKRETSRRRVVTGEKKPDEPEGEDQGFDIPWWKIKTRLDLAKYQTINLVSQLRDDQSFEIIMFSKDVTPWMGKLVPATPINRQKAIAMLELVKPEDATNTWGALAAAFDMVDVNKKGDALGPDEMYLVTDGAPSLGDIVDSQQILEATLQLCKVKPLRINVIGVGVDLSFLRKLARDTGGQSKFFK
jgi:hypothetical protein